MPALNRVYLIEGVADGSVLFCNFLSTNINDFTAVSKTPPGTISENSAAKYYCTANESTGFMVLIPDGYDLNVPYVYNDVEDRWELANWIRVTQSTTQAGELNYYDDTDQASPVFDGYRAFTFIDYDGDKEPNSVSFVFSFNITKT